MAIRKGASYLSIKFLVAIILLVASLIAIYGYNEISRGQRNLQKIMEREGLALAGALEISSRNAVTGNQLLEDMIARRLLNNARFIDALLESRAIGLEELPRIARANQLHLIEVRGPQGNLLADSNPPPREPLQPPGPMMGPGMMGRGMMGPGTMTPPPIAAEGRGQMQEHMRRMFYGPLLEGKATEALEGFGERKFWEGGDYGVAVRRKAGGVIVIKADAGYVLNFRQEMGLQRLIKDLKARPEIEYIAIQDKNFVYLAHSDPEQVGKQEKAPFLASFQTSESGRTRFLKLAKGDEVLEVVKPFTLGKENVGIIRVGLSTAPLTEVWKESLNSIFIFAGALLFVGAAAAVAIFFTQRRHIGALRALEEDMRRWERLAGLGNLAAGVGHEVRNPLNAIAMGLQRLQREFVPEGREEEYSKFTELIRGEISRLNSIIDRFLQLARVPALSKQPCDLNTLLDEVGTLMKGEALAKGVGLLMVPPPRPYTFLGDSQQLKQALINIVLNAVQATPAAGEVRIGAEKKGKELRITVSDTGSGIPHEGQERIFDPYYTTKEKGMGLGLPLAQSIVHEHEGRIEVQSRPGKGAAFTIVLPA